jgi:hypothetical protein
MNAQNLPILSAERLEKMIHVALAQPQDKRRAQPTLWSWLSSQVGSQADGWRAGLALVALVTVLAISAAQMPYDPQEENAQDALGEISEMMTLELFDNLS